MSEDDAKLVSAAIEGEKETLQKLSMEIWSNPELCFQEFHAHSVLTEALEKYGFGTTRSYVMPTAFRAEWSNGDGGGPVIAMLCEYDSLPDIGHACGHNLIAESGVAAAIAVKAAMDYDASLTGKVVVLGCPAEEGGGGKIKLINAGAFKDIDAALMVHPSRRHLAVPTHSCREKIQVIYRGNASHSCDPWRGKNALDAAVAAYVNIGLLRQQIKPSCRIHGIIKRGGTHCAIIPEETEVHFFVRAATEEELVILRKRVIQCFESAAEATNCISQIAVEEDNTYLNLITNQVLISLFKDYSRPLGVQFQDDDAAFIDPLSGGGSSDVGNVSYEVPTIQPIFNTGPHKIHTKLFREQAATPEAHQAARTAAKALALTAVRLMRCPQLVQEAKSSFNRDLAHNRRV